ncbi:MAG: hypothetical protein EBT72_07740 [Flavobacteriia bacterium]|nr:hypothetical protein [Flavobacteriia bacterium]
MRETAKLTHQCWPPSKTADSPLSLIAPIALQKHRRRVAIVTHIVHPRLIKTNKTLVLQWFNIVLHVVNGAG